MSFAVDQGTQPPFGTQSMQEVLDRINFIRDEKKFVKESIKHGVLMTKAIWASDKAHKDFMRKTLFPVADKVGDESLLHHATFDRQLYNKGNNFDKDKPPKYNPRGGKIFASRERICNFLGAQHRARRNGEVSYITNTLRQETTGYYWESDHPQPVHTHPYVDIDTKVNITDDCKFDTIFKPVWELIKMMDAFIKDSCQLTDVRVLILMNHRQIDTKVFKWSFHLHWPQVVMTNVTDLQHLMLAFNEVVPPQFSGVKLVDTKTYSAANQLFRMPYCGKMGDKMAVLECISPFKDNVTGVWRFEESKRPYEDVLNDSCTSTTTPSRFTHIVYNRPQHSVGRRLQGVQGVVLPEAENNKEYGRWMNFWGPILRLFVVPNFIKFRQDQAKKRGVVCSFPNAVTKTTRILRLTQWPASFRVEVEGDTYCEYDHGATPFVHSYNSNSTTYVVDLEKGLICQQCIKCRDPALKWYNFIKTADLEFPIMQDSQQRCESSSIITVKKSTDFVPFVLKYYTDTVLYTSGMKQVMVYDDSAGIWKTSSEGNRILLGKVTILNKNYQEYLCARNMHIMGATVNEWIRLNPSLEVGGAEYDLFYEKQVKACREANNSNGVIWSLTTAARKDLISTMKPDDHPHRVENMEPYPHLVPLLDGMCVDVYTFQTRKSRPSDYFVSHLNAKLLHLLDNEVVEFKKWQLQVCCADPAYLDYKLQIMGLSLTLLDFDRAFYMPLGPIGRNGKSSESFLFNEVAISTTPPRGYYVPREYLTKSGQDRKGANAPDTALMEMANKTILIADECRDAPLDGALIKTMVSGDRASGRNLYETERSVVSCQGKLWIIANKTLKLDYTDPALMDRLRILPYNARWVNNPAEVQSKIMDVHQRMFVFQDDPYFKDKILKNWGNALVTAGLHALHVFMSALPRDPEDPTRPLKLESIKPPKVVVDATNAKIAKENPVLMFIKDYMGTTAGECVRVDVAFTQFQQFGKNENSFRIKYMDRGKFEEAFLKENIDVDRDANGVNRFKGYKMVKDVPILDIVGGGGVVSDGHSYVPGPAEPLAKRHRDEDDAFY